MTRPALEAVLRLIVLTASFEHRFNPTLMSAHRLSLEEVILMLHLARAPVGRMRRGDLASALNMGLSSITRLSAPLENEKLVARETDDRDARVTYLAITEAGRQRVAEATVSLDQMALKAFSDRWTDEEIQDLSASLARLTHAIPGFLG